MPANLAAMLRSLVKAKQTASLIELRFLRDVARILPRVSANGSSKKKDEDLSRHVEEIGLDDVDGCAADIGARDAEHVRRAADDRMRDRGDADISGRRSRRGRIP